MIPDPGEILRRRVTAATIIRIIAVIPATASVGVATGWIVRTIVDSWMDAEDHVAFAVMTGIFAVIAAVQWAIAPFLSRKMIRVPRAVVCPGCNYRLVGLTTHQCPECGLPLTREFLAEPGAHTPPPRDPDRALLCQVATTVLRLLLIVSLLIFVPVSIFTTIEVARWSGNDPEEWIALAALYMFVILNGGLVLLAGLLARLIVPQRRRFEPKAPPRPAPDRPNPDRPPQDRPAPPTHTGPGAG